MKDSFYKDAIKNSTQNTKQAIAKIQKSLTNPSAHSSNVPPSNKHKGENIEARFCAQNLIKTLRINIYFYLTKRGNFYKAEPKF
ncbi:hypothetical protein RCA_02150 [Rickettsia canadensis str. CA410]|uniref:Uncharacterized protein n=1 Tax=Rickettsia canadensis str. CA410 TaxID=1105107 RepID=A0ABN4A9G8_RICCA|nr:hypothetical protein RCA_02150 [Rickettsia canadensis str. CA410]